MNRISICLMLVLIVILGCAALSPEQIERRDDRRDIDAENWWLCQKVIKANNIRWMSKHDHRTGSIHRPREILEDLHSAQCRRLLGEYWIRYE